MLSSLKNYQVYLIHAGVLISIYTLLYLAGVVDFTPSEDLLNQWDAGWYKSILELGYQFQKEEQSNTGFFPLFPLTWGLTGLSNVGISILNFLFFFIGISLIGKTIIKLDTKVLFFSLSMPSLFFMFVPYSEALFFLTASLYLLGNHYSNNYLKAIALLLSSLARPTIFFFLPAIIFSEFLSSDKNLTKVKSIIGLSFIILLGTILSFYVVGYNSGNFFAYSDSQINNWDHSFSLPSLPLTTWRGYRILWLDFFGLWVVISALIGSIVYFVKFLQNKAGQIINKNLLLSLSYLSMILVYVLFFHPKEESTGLTSILSLNRYVFCSPFVFYLIYYFYKTKNLRVGFILLFSLLVCLLLIGIPYMNIAGLNYSESLVFGLGIVFFIVLQVSPSVLKNKLCYYGLYLINCGLQVYLFQSFLKGNWIG